MNQRALSSRNHPLTMLVAIARQWAASYLGLALLAALAAGLLIGWAVFGGIIAPVVYVDAKPSRLSAQYQEVLLSYAADSYVCFSPPIEEVAKRLGEGWTKAQVISRIDQMIQARRPGADRLSVLKDSLIAYPSEVGPIAVPRSTDGSLGLIAGALMVIVVFGVLVVRRIRLDRVPPATDGAAPASHGLSAPPPVAANPPPVKREAEDKPAWPGEGREPLAQYETSYALGHDRYDESFNIETRSGDFLGECGVGIAEVVGSGAPDKVAALEVWLFDKNDIRTLTKVLMGEQCYHNEGLRAKLAPKGDAVLAKKDDVFTLQTQTLRVKVRIDNLVYGPAGGAAYFQQVDIKLAAWNMGP